MIESYFYDTSLDYKIKDKINKLSKDFQERCFELDEPYPKANKRTVPCIYNFIGYETSKDADDAFNILNSLPLPKDSKKYFRKYHEGYSLIDVINDPKEAYLFYNSL